MENVSSSNSHEGLVPKLRFPEFQGEWTSSKLGEIGTFTKGAALSKADISDEGTPFILYGELYTTYGEITYNVVRKTDKTANEVHYSQIGDVIIPTSGETPEEIATSTCVMCSGVILAGDLNIYRTSVVDGRIVSFIINHVINDKIAKVAQGKSVVHVKADEIAKMTINYPTPQEQSKILTLLELIESRISKQRELIEHLKSYKRGVLSAVFGKNNDNWIEVQLDEIGNVLSGYGFPNRFQGEKTFEIPFYKVSDMNLPENNVIMKSANNYISSQTADIMHIVPIQHTAIVFAKVGAAIALERKKIANPPFLIDNNMMAFLPDKTVSVSFIYQYFQFIKLSSHIQIGALPSYNASDIGSIRVKIPKDKSDQEKIGRMLEIIDNKIEYEISLQHNQYKLRQFFTNSMFI